MGAWTAGFGGGVVSCGTRLAFVDAVHPQILYVLIRTGASHPVYGAGEGERLVPWPAWASDGIRAASDIRCLQDNDPWD